ncbi:hypothetical protein FKM82_027646, partial [Ascaphus truei]
LLTGVCFAADVLQTPALIVSPMEETVSFRCEHQDNTYPNKYWYRQVKGQRLDLIGYTYRDGVPNMESEFNGKNITIHSEGAQKSTLIISNVSVGDSAVYYCAS